MTLFNLGPFKTLKSPTCKYFFNWNLHFLKEFTWWLTVYQSKLDFQGFVLSSQPSFLVAFIVDHWVDYFAFKVLHKSACSVPKSTLFIFNQCSWFWWIVSSPVKLSRVFFSVWERGCPWAKVGNKAHRTSDKFPNICGQESFTGKKLSVLEGFATSSVGLHGLANIKVMFYLLMLQPVTNCLYGGGDFTCANCLRVSCWVKHQITHFRMCLHC